VWGEPRLLTDRMTELPLVQSARIPVTSTYHGVEVTEDFRWLEDAASEETIAWTKAQQHRTHAYVSGIPWRAALTARVEQLLTAERTEYLELLSGGGTYFALKVQPPRQQPLLVALAGLDDLATERVVVDPNVIDPSGETAIDFFVPSPDGTLVAVSLSEHGSEDGALHVIDVQSGKVVSEPIPHVNLMGGSVTWRHDASGFWYTLCADPAGFWQQVWFRDLDGSPDRVDQPAGFADEQVAENVLSASPDGRWVMDRVQKGDGGEWQIFLRGQEVDGAWWQVADIPDNCPLAALGTDALYLLSRRDAPRGKVLRLAPTSGATIDGAEEIVPSGDLVIEDLAVTRAAVWVVDIDGGPQQVRAFDPRSLLARTKLSFGRQETAAQTEAGHLVVILAFGPPAPIRKQIDVDARMLPQLSVVNHLPFSALADHGPRDRSLTNQFCFRAGDVNYSGRLVGNCGAAVDN